jgi:hypothetical protein
MGRLELDLSAADAKLERAREHLNTMQCEAPIIVKKETTHAVRFSEVDP